MNRQYARNSLRLSGRPVGIRSMERVCKDVHRELTEQFGPVRAASLGELLAPIEEAFLESDFRMKSEHFVGLDNIAQKLYFTTDNPIPFGGYDPDGAP